MKITEDIYLSRPQDLGQSEDIRSNNIMDELINAARHCTRIDIFSAYYSIDTIHRIAQGVGSSRSLRSRCEIGYVLNGLSGEALIDQIRALRLLEADLRKTGFKNLDGYVFLKAPLFHTKLFRFIRTTHVTWYIGSANVSENVCGRNHELLVRLTGAHKPLLNYVNAVYASATPIAGVSNTPPAPKNLPAFFRTGSLIFRPRAHPPFSFDGLTLTAAQRIALTNALMENITAVPDADLRAQGLRFNLARAAAVDIEGVFALAPQQSTRSGQLASYTIETNLGYWLPDAYRPRVEATVKRAVRSRRERFKQLGDRLSGMGYAAICARFSTHLDAAIKLLSDQEVPVKVDREKRLEQFSNFLKRRLADLNNEEFLDRFSQIFIMERMPEIWEDVGSVRAFVRSFCDDLVYWLHQSGPRTHRIIRSFREALALDTLDREADQIETTLSNYLEQRGWPNENWL